MAVTRSVILQNEDFEPLIGVEVLMYDVDTGDIITSVETDLQGVAAFVAVDTAADYWFRPRATRNSGMDGKMALTGVINLTAKPGGTASLVGVEGAIEDGDDTNFLIVAAPFVTSFTSAAARTNAGIRFPNVEVPQGATIVSALMTFIIAGAGPDDPNLVMYGNDVDDAASFAVEADINSRARTTANVSWVQDNIGTGSKTAPDIATLLQEVVSRAGWVSGNDFMVLFIANSNNARSISLGSPADATIEVVWS